MNNKAITARFYPDISSGVVFDIHCDEGSAAEVLLPQNIQDQISLEPLYESDPNLSIVTLEHVLEKNADRPVTLLARRVTAFVVTVVTACPGSSYLVCSEFSTTDSLSLLRIVTGGGTALTSDEYLRAYKLDFYGTSTK